MGLVGWGQATALHFSHSAIDGRFVSPIRIRDMLSYQSLMPAGAGTPRCEKPELWLGAANLHGGVCHALPPAQRGTSPRATFADSAIDHWFTIRHA